MSAKIIKVDIVCIIFNYLRKRFRTCYYCITADCI